MSIRNHLLHSSSYQVGTLFAVLMLVGVVFVSYWLVIASDNALLRESEEAIRAEIRAFEAANRFAGPEAVSQLLVSRSEEHSSYFYSLRGVGGEVLAGNIPAWPDTVERLNEGTILFEIAHELLPDRRPSRRMASEHFDVMAKIHTFDDQRQLLVGRDVDDLEIAQWVAEAFGWGMIAILLAICVLSYGVAYYVASRFNRIAAITERIIATGNLGERLQVDSNWDDLSKLSQLLNRMLEELELRVNGIQSVTDSIAHDLRTPLTRLRTRIAGQVEGDVREDLLGEVDGLMRVFNSLLRISAIDAGKEPMADRAISPASLVADVVELYEPLALERGIALIATGDNARDVRGDADLLFQALANLVDNALKFTPDDGEVRVEVEDRVGEIVISVEDNGPGIPAGQRKQALQRFGRLDSSRSTPGNGLGLSLATAILRRHGGALELSDARGFTSGLRASAVLPAWVPAKA